MLMACIMKDWCRLCARESFDEQHFRPVECYRRIYKYLAIQVQSDNDFPRSVCKDCCDTLTNFDNYALQCERVQSMFKNILMQDSNNIETIRAYKNNFLRYAKDENLLSFKDIKIEEIPIEIESGSQNSTNSVKKIIIKSWNETKLKEEKNIKDDDSIEVNDEVVYFDEYYPSSEEDYLPLSSISDKTSKGHKRKEHKKLSKNLQKSKRKKKCKSKDKLSILEKLINESIKTENKSDEEIADKNTCEAPIQAAEKEAKKLKKKIVYDSLVSYECYVCKEDLNNWHALCLHFRDVHNTRAKIRCCCGKLLASRVSITRHCASHGKTESFSCSKCDKRFPRQSELQSHMITHLPKEQYPFVCCKCARRFTSQQLLKHHEKKHIPVEERMTHLCEECKSKFASKSSLLAHMRAVHQRLKPFVCDQCGRAFTTKGILEEHQVRHSDARPHICNVCHKSFKTKQRLSIHLDTHNDTVYQCPHCPVLLNSRRTLRMHLFVHDEVSRYQCSFCDKAFKRAKDLKNHTNLHTGKRPYSCPWCSRTFANGSNCRAHKRRMHPHELRISDAKVAMINKVIVDSDTKPNGDKNNSENVEPKIIQPIIKRKLTTLAMDTKTPNFMFNTDMSEKKIDITPPKKHIGISLSLPGAKLEMETTTKQEKSSPTHIYESSLSPLNLNTSAIPPKCDEIRSENPVVISPTQNNFDLSNYQNNSTNISNIQNPILQIKNQQQLSSSFSVTNKEIQTFSKPNQLFSSFAENVQDSYIIPDISIPPEYTGTNPYGGNN